MHSQSTGTNFHQIKLLQDELKLMDYSIDKMLMEKNIIPMSVWYAFSQLNRNLKQFDKFLNQYINKTSTYLESNSVFKIQNERCFKILYTKKRVEKKGIKFKIKANDQLFNDSKIDWKNTLEDIIILSKNNTRKIKNQNLIVESNLKSNNKPIKFIWNKPNTTFHSCFEAILKFGNNIKFVNKVQRNLLENQSVYLKSKNPDINYFKTIIREVFVNMTDQIEKLKLNRSFCDSQPPILCKYRLNYYVFVKFHCIFRI